MQKLYIIKIGGNIINDDQKLIQFLSMVSTIKGKKIIIHGGGKLVDQLAEKLGIVQQMIDGRRVTDAETLKLATMVYAGLINKKIVALLQSHATHAIGLSGADNNCIQSKRRINSKNDFGFVGDIEKEGINTVFISTLIEEDIVPVFCSITHNNKGQLLNTNADTIASEIAIAMSQNYEVQLNYCLEMKGVMKNIDDESSVLPSITIDEYRELICTGIVSKGMIPKLDNAFAAIHKGVKKVVILHADDILYSINNDKNVGTTLSA